MPDFMAPMTMKVGRRPSDRSVTSGSEPSLRSLLWVGGDEDPVRHDGVSARHGHRWDRVQHRWYGACDGRARPRGPRALVLARPGGPRRRRPWRARPPAAPCPHPRAPQGAARAPTRPSGSRRSGRPGGRRSKLDLDPDVVNIPDWMGEGLMFSLTPGLPVVSYLHTPAAVDHRAQPAGAGLAGQAGRPARAHGGATVHHRHLDLAAARRRPHRARLARPRRGPGDPGPARRRALRLGRAGGGVRSGHPRGRPGRAPQGTRGRGRGDRPAGRRRSRASSWSSSVGRAASSTAGPTGSGWRPRPSASACGSPSSTTSNGPRCLQWYGRSRVVAVPSHYESFSITAVEARGLRPARSSAARGSAPARCWATTPRSPSRSATPRRWPTGCGPSCSTPGWPRRPGSACTTRWPRRARPARSPPGGSRSTRRRSSGCGRRRRRRRGRQGGRAQDGRLQACDGAAEPALHLGDVVLHQAPQPLAELGGDRRLLLAGWCGRSSRRAGGPARARRRRARPATGWRFRRRPRSLSRDSPVDACLAAGVDGPEVVGRDRRGTRPPPSAIRRCRRRAPRTP